MCILRVLYSFTAVRWFCCLLFSGLLFLTASPAYASSAVASLDTGSFDQHLVLHDKLVYRADSPQGMSVEAVIALSSSDVWDVSPDTIPNLGLGVNAHWFAIRLINSADQPRRGILDVPYTMLDYLDVYFVRGDDAQLVAEVGDQRPFSQRPLANRNFLVPIELPAGDDVLILIRAESFGALSLPLEMWSLKAFFEYDQSTIALQLIFTGLMLALAIYNLFLLIATRDWNYLWYVISVVSITFVVLSFHGILAQFVWPETPKLNNPVLVASISVNLFAASLFAYTFLNLQRFSWPVRAAFLSHSAAGVSIFVLNLFLPYAITIKLVALFSVTGATIAIITGCYLWYRGDVLARFYTVAWFLLLTGSVTITFSHFGWLPNNALFEYGQQIGAAAEGLMLSFALAYRINLEKSKRYEAQSQLLQLQQQANQELELRVNDRTAALAEANKRLLEKSLTDGLTDIHNRKFFDQQLAHEWNKNARASSSICLLMIDGDKFKQINDTYGHQGGDALLIHLARVLKSTVQRAGDFVCRYGGEEFTIVLCNTPINGAAVIAERIRKQVESSSVDWGGEPLSITISIGVACANPKTAYSPSSLISAADEALYAAKNAGRNKVMINLCDSSAEATSHIVSLDELINT